MNIWLGLGLAWLTVSAGTFLFLSLLVFNAFKHGGLEKFKALNISFPALIIVVVVMSLLFPVAWHVIYQLIEEKK